MFNLSARALKCVDPPSSSCSSANPSHALPKVANTPQLLEILHLRTHTEGPKIRCVNLLMDVVMHRLYQVINYELQ